MRRYIVVAHKTLGGAHLLDHLRDLRDADPYCRFHLVVPMHRPSGHPAPEDTIRSVAGHAVDEMLDRLAAMRIGAVGEVGDDDPVDAVGDVIAREGGDHFTGIIVSTLPLGISRWWRSDVPTRLEAAYPTLPVTHLVADERLHPADEIEPFLLPPPF